MLKFLIEPKSTKHLNNFFFRKNKELIIKGVLKPKVFLVLFSLFFSSLALAAPLSVTWKGGLIPGGNNNGGPGDCTATINGVALTLDRTENPYDVVFSNDGLQVFTVNFSDNGPINYNQLSMNRLGTPNEILTEKIKNDANATCADIDGAHPGVISGEIEYKLVGLHIGNGLRSNANCGCSRGRNFKCSYKICKW